MSVQAHTLTAGGTASGPPARVSGIVALLAVVAMLAGAALYFSSGADIEVALADGEFAQYLEAAASNNTALYANLTLWIAGSALLGSAGRLFVAGRPGVAAELARHVFTYGAATAAVAFVTWMGLIRYAAAGGAQVELADLVGFIAWHADVLATFSLVGAGPALVALASRGSWMPRWLALWGYGAAVVGCVSIGGAYVATLAGPGFLIVPVGLGWMAAAGVVAIRGRA